MTSKFKLSGGVSRRAFLRGSAAASAALALAGCGQAAQSGSSDAASAGDASSSSSANASGDLAKISFVLDYTPNTNHTGIYVAQAKGYFADEGLDVEIVQPPEDGADALIGAGGAQMGVSYQDVMANSFSSDQPMPYTAVAAIIQHNTSGIMSRAADGITRPKLMENHTYATWDMPVEQATIKDVVEADGGDYSKINLVPYNVDDEVSGLKANMFDTVWVYEGCPDQVKAFLRAVKKGYEFCVENPSDAADILCDAVPELDSDLVHASQDYLKDQYIADASSWGVIDANRWAKFYQWLNDQNLVENKLDVNKGYDLSYLEA